MTLKSKLESVFGDSDERAVSPVIGVILMVAITVILAAVIATFVLDLGGDQQQAPQASFSFSGDASSLDVTHGGGDTMNSDNIVFKGAGAGGSTWTTEAGLASAQEIGAGDSAELTGLTSGETLRVVYQFPNSDKTASLGTYEVP